LNSLAFFCSTSIKKTRIQKKCIKIIN
jgi:hypothetical protein